MIIFKVLRYKNLLSTGNQFTEIKLDSHQTTLVIGKNGSGKSTMIEAISFGLYGKPYRKINKPQLLNSIIKKELVVEVEFSVGKLEYKIIRGIKPNIFELYKNGALLNQDAASKDYQEILEKQILKINHKSFCQVVILGTANFVPFMQLATQARREIIEDILDLQIFTTMNTLLKDRVSGNNESLNGVISDKKVIVSQIEMMKSHYENIQKSNEKFIEERHTKISSTRDLIKNAEEDVRNIIEEGRALKTKLDGKEVHKSKISKLDEFKYKFNAKLQTAKTTTKFFHENSTCPTCTQDIEETFRKTMISTNQKVIEDANAAFTKIETERAKLNKKLEEFNVIANNLNDLNLKLSQINTKTTMSSSVGIKLMKQKRTSLN
jgi:DNA repair exonuclease SbcCD ATPase subunit